MKSVSINTVFISLLCFLLVSCDQHKKDVVFHVEYDDILVSDADTALSSYILNPKVSQWEGLPSYYKRAKEEFPKKSVSIKDDTLIIDFGTTEHLKISLDIKIINDSIILNYDPNYNSSSTNVIIPENISDNVERFNLKIDTNQQSIVVIDVDFKYRLDLYVGDVLVVGYNVISGKSILSMSE